MSRIDDLINQDTVPTPDQCPNMRLEAFVEILAKWVNRKIEDEITKMHLRMELESAKCNKS